MSFGKDLSKEFENLVRSKKFTEFQLCTKLEDTFINLSSIHEMYVEVIHGSKSMVEFEYKANYISSITPGVKKKCELGDMLFIVFSKKKKQIRLMYMQNRQNRKSFLCRYDSTRFTEKETYYFIIKVTKMCFW